jgi:succinate-semialdehyde dehydrogenase/glutarate-semialdehyde dehydrogenase
MALLQPVTPRELHGRRKLEVFAPATLERLGEIEVASADDGRAAVARARAAQADWAARSFEDRGRFLLRARDLLVERADAIADVICRDTGKPRLEAMTSEILGACDALTFYAKNARRLLRDEKKRLHLMKTKKLVLSYRPIGVVGIITPWNFPFLLGLNPSVQALAAGNAVVLKPSEITPFVGLALAQLFADAGLPDGVFQVVTGDGPTGAALVEAGCDKISFTGSGAPGAGSPRPAGARSCRARSSSAARTR